MVMVYMVVARPWGRWMHNLLVFAVKVSARFSVCLFRSCRKSMKVYNPFKAAVSQRSIANAGHVFKMS